MRTFTKLLREDRDSLSIPRYVQDIIPISRIWEDGIFLVGKNKYSKCFSFTDVNYAVASREDKEDIFKISNLQFKKEYIFK